MRALLLHATVPGKAGVSVYDHNGHATAIGRYQVVKTWIVPATPRKREHTRQTFSYRHQKPAAARVALQWLCQFGDVHWRAGREEFSAEVSAPTVPLAS